jgi:hypothetical protein
MITTTDEKGNKALGRGMIKRQMPQQPIINYIEVKSADEYSSKVEIFHRAYKNISTDFQLVVSIARIVPFLISIIWLGKGVWQWFVLSKWSKKYERYRELQKKIDKKLEEVNIL